MKQGTVFFFTGLAGAGKTTIGGLFYERFKATHPDAILIDGDRNRAAKGFDRPKDYSTESRRAEAFRIFQTCKEYADRGLDVVCCLISMYHDVRAWNRANIENYVEIYVRVEWETLLRRNQKGLYSPGQKNVVGVDLLCEEPEQPDFILQNDGDKTPLELVESLEQQLFH